MACIVFESGARILDGTPGESDEDFWQSIHDLAYMLNDEAPKAQQKRLVYFLDHFPPLDPDLRDLESFRRSAVNDLLRALYPSV